MKSNCCGDLTILPKGETKYYICKACSKPCNSIPDNIMSLKEIVEFCNDCLEFFGAHDAHSYEQFLKCVKHHMGEV